MRAVLWTYQPECSPLFVGLISSFRSGTPLTYIVDNSRPRPWYIDGYDAPGAWGPLRGDLYGPLCREFLEFIWKVRDCATSAPRSGEIFVSKHEYKGGFRARAVAVTVFPRIQDERQVAVSVVCAEDAYWDFANNAFCGSLFGVGLAAVLHRAFGVFLGGIPDWQDSGRVFEAAQRLSLQIACLPNEPLAIERVAGDWAEFLRDGFLPSTVEGRVDQLWL